MVIVYLTIRLLSILEWILVLSCLASWFPQVRESKLGEILYILTEPMVAPCRSLLSRIPALNTMPLDFSPLLAFFIITAVQRVLYALL